MTDDIILDHRGYPGGKGGLANRWRAQPVGKQLVEEITGWYNCYKWGI